MKSSPFLIVLRRIRESGLLYTTFLILDHCVPKNIFRFIKMSVQEIRLAEGREECRHAPNIRWATLHDWSLLRQAGYAAGSLRHRFASSCRAAIYEENGEIIGASWYAPLAMAQWEEYQVSFDFPPTGIWNFDLWVLPSHRGKGIARRILGFANAALYAEGYREAYCVIVDMNKNSLTAYRKAGSREIGHFLFIRILNLAYFRTASARHFGRFDRRRTFAVPLSVQPAAQAEPP